MKKYYLKPRVWQFTPPYGPFVLCESGGESEEESSVANWNIDSVSMGSLF